MTDDQIIAKCGIEKPSQFQMDIFREFIKQVTNCRSGKKPSSLFVSATAGSGKTTSSVACSRLVPQGMTVAFLAFNKSIADELQSRLPTHIRASTLNSAGFSAWGRYYRGKTNVQPTVDGHKTFNIMKDLYSYTERTDYGKDVASLVSKCKAHGLVPRGVLGVKPVEGEYADDHILLEMAFHYDMFIKPSERPTVFRMVREVLTKSIEQEDVIDFDDQKYLTIVKNPGGAQIPFFKNDIVFVDEAQDLNLCEMEMVRRMLKPNGFIVAVADRNQSISGFKGSDINAVDKLVDRFNCTTLPLSISYRCSRKIVEQAQLVNPMIQPSPDAEDGIVKTLDQFDHSVFRAGDMVLCRNNAPLVQLAYGLISKGTPVFIRGKDLGEKLVGIMRRAVGIKTKKQDDEFLTYSTNEMMKALRRMLSDARSQMSEDDVSTVEAYYRLDDQVKAVEAVAEATGALTAGSLVDHVRHLFGEHDEGKHVHLSTIHKAKGLEADRVFILDKHLIYPSWRAGKEDSWQGQQDRNIHFVSETRAKKEMYFIKSDNFVNA